VGHWTSVAPVSGTPAAVSADRSARSGRSGDVRCAVVTSPAPLGVCSSLSCGNDVRLASNGGSTSAATSRSGEETEWKACAPATSDSWSSWCPRHWRPGKRPPPRGRNDHGREAMRMVRAARMSLPR
jgi:hypothetical protein